MDALPDTLESALDGLRAVRRASQGAKQQAASRVARLGRSAVRPLLELLSSRDRAGADAAGQALVLLGDAAEPSVEALLNHRSTRVRERAANVLLGIGTPAAIESLRMILAQELAGQRDARRVLAVQRIVRASVASALVAWIWVMGDIWNLLHKPWLLLGGLALIIGGATFYLDATRRLRRRASSGLAGKDDVRLAGVLSACLVDADASVRLAAAEGLKRVLPGVTDACGMYFGPESVDGLLRSLGGSDRGLTIAILQALAEIGDERALPYVERFAHDRFSGWDPRVYQAANGALPRILTRVTKERESRTLLRAASPPEDESTVLLRPAASSDSQPTQLLRPSGPDSQP